MPMQPPPQRDKSNPSQVAPAADRAHADRKESRDATANFANPNAALPDAHAANLPDKSQLERQYAAVEGKLASLEPLKKAT